MYIDKFIVVVIYGVGDFCGYPIYFIKKQIIK